jgi:hypothetical protein
MTKDPFVTSGERVCGLLELCGRLHCDRTNHRSGCPVAAQRRHLHKPGQSSGLAKKISGILSCVVVSAALRHDKRSVRDLW